MMGQMTRLRIALYYAYVDIPPGQLEEQVEFHRTLCEGEGLNGRIRISTEGINGVLSGDLEALRRYEEQATERLGLDEGGLKVKYCLLRDDIPARSQTFDELIVKKTSSVISLFDTDPKKNVKKSRRGKRGTRRVQENDDVAREPNGRIEDPPESSTDQATIQENMMKASPAPHLNPEEWHEYLSKATDPLLLDCRNVYESRIGYFASEKGPTLLTNTRKYSDLPNILANNPHVKEKQEIFMYCTGGVRCERVSMLVQSLYPDKKVFQLGGGIQTYLEIQSQNGNDPPGSKVSNLFLGKNFVFDPRRVDPVHGSVSVIGKCMICGVPHDDYDNGHAPSEAKEARCNNCRMLLLVCNSCRPNYACWGEESSPSTPPLFCGIDQCIHEGAAPEPQLLLAQHN